MLHLNIIKYILSSSQFLLCRRMSYNKKIVHKVNKNKQNILIINSIQDEILSNAIINNNVQTNEDWTSLKESILEKGKDINNVNFDAKTMGFCITHKNYVAAKSFINFIQTEKVKPNVATIGKFMRLYYVCHNDDKAIKNEEDNIINMYKELKEMYPLIPAILAENVIHGLSVTSHWRECLKLLDNMKTMEKPSASTYSTVIAAAFNNRENDLGWNLLREMICIPRLPLPVVFHTWLKQSAAKHNEFHNIGLLLSFLEDNDIHPSKDVTDTLLDVLKPFSYDGNYTSVTNRGICQHCKQQLQKIHINSDDFDKLRREFMDNVIIGKNIFNKTTPEELINFKKYINNMPSCDIVIDGLNVAYSAGVKKPARLYAKLLANVVKYFCQKSKKVLVLGRSHMNKWPKEYMDFIAANAHMFLTQNISQDDPFLLYATMTSGLGTNFLSRDFMRGHLYLLMDQKMKKLFRNWQQVHQYSLIYVENNGKVHIRSPFPYLTTVQSSKDGWHVPYVEEHLANPPASLEPPKNWLCIRKRH